jgi:hypothetical protein
MTARHATVSRASYCSLNPPFRCFPCANILPDFSASSTPIDKPYRSFRIRSGFGLRDTAREHFVRVGWICARQGEQNSSQRPGAGVKLLQGHDGEDGDRARYLRRVIEFNMDC